MLILRTFKELKDKLRHNEHNTNDTHNTNVELKSDETIDWNDISENPDREYMEQCHNIDIDRPILWSQYYNDPLKIIEIEFNDLKVAKNSKKTPEEIKKHIYRLSVACLNYWRHLNIKR